MYFWLESKNEDCALILIILIIKDNYLYVNDEFNWIYEYHENEIKNSIIKKIIINLKFIYLI